MSYEIRELPRKEFPKALLEIPQPPKKLFVGGVLPDENEYAYLAVVGSRRASSYGKAVCEKLIEGLAGSAIAIVSGLALGIDSIAHRAAMKAGLPTVGVPGSGLSPEALYPRTHVNLAKEIVESGALLSEFESDFRATPWSFPQRNRIMAGLSKAVLIIEAGEKSGTLITARLATEYNRDLFVVPNGIFSEGSAGSNRLLRQGALAVTSSADILNALGLEEGEQKSLTFDCSPEEVAVLQLLTEPKPRDEIIRELKLPAGKGNSILMVMEIKGMIQEIMGEIHRA